MKRKIIAMLLCVALTVALFSTLAVAAEENVTQPATCTCDNQDGTHAETCPCYVAPAPVVPAPSAPVCNCESTDGTHKEGCPLNLEPEKPKLDVEAMYNQLLAMTTCAEMEPVLDSLTQEEAALFSQEQMDAIMAHYHELYVQEHSMAYIPDTVNFTAVAPFFRWDFDMISTLDLYGDDAPVSGTNRVDNSGVESKKTAVRNDDGTYTITLESFITGNVTAGTIKPCDIVLVLDMSTSMRNDFSSSSSEYSKVYTLDTSKTYYVSGRNNRYTQVDYCNTCQAWTDGCYHIDYFNLEGTKYTPKTSESDTTGTQFYEYKTIASVSRLDALKQAATAFVDTVAGKQEDNKIAVVGFHDDGVYLTGSNANSALYDAKTQSATIKSAITGIVESGNNSDLKAATDHDDGLKLAEDIFDANDNSTGARNRVVVMITDGEPAPLNTSNWSENTVSRAITSSYNLKNSYGATVYTVSVMPGSNAANPTSNMDKYMSYLSSNYPDAQYTGNVTSTTNTNTIISRITPGDRADTGSTSYYLSANDTSSLNSIFSQIAAQTGGASVNLDATTVVTDAISDYFTLPENATADSIKVYTANATGTKDAAGNYQFNDRTASNLKATISGKNVSVTGFDFTYNFVAETGRTEGDVTAPGNFHGRKLIIEFNVVPESEFWGGNGVPTNNASTTGIYKGQDVIENFEEPKVNVPIKQVTLTPKDANIYLMGTVPNASDLYTTNYPAQEDWKTTYVKVTAPAPGTISNTNDGDYTISITVEPKYDAAQSDATQGPAAVATSATTSAHVNVFTPQLTFKDSTVYYGDTAPINPTGYTTNNYDATATVWKHGTTLNTAAAMIGTAPILDLTYDPGAGVVDGKITFKTDIPVDVAVKIGTTDVTGKTSFVHTPCSTDETAPTDGKFWLHVKTCTLTITKAAATGTTIGTDEYFVFNVLKDGQPYTQVTIKGTGSAIINELPVGTYTIEEDTGVAWRYDTPTYSANAVLSATNPTGTLTCTNTKTTDNWLNHFSRVINTYGKKTGTQG